MCNCLTLNIDSVNSELSISGTLNGKNTYSDGTYTVSWNGSRWEVYEEVSGCDVISVTYQLIGEEPVTVEVEKEGDEYTIEGVGTIEKVGSEWNIINSCTNEFARVTYTFEGNLYTVDMSRVGEYNGEGFYILNQSYDLYFDGENWVFTIIDLDLTATSPDLETWTSYDLTDISAEFVNLPNECIVVNIDNIGYDIQKRGILNGKNYYYLRNNSIQIVISFDGEKWMFNTGFSPTTSSIYSLLSIDNIPISNDWAYISGVELTSVTTTDCNCDNTQAALPLDTPCPFGTYTIEEGSIFESFVVEPVETLIGTNTNNTVCPLGIFTPIAVTNVNITECFNENDIQSLIQLTEQLYPTGRGFNIHIGSFIRKMHLALARSESRLNDNTLDILNGILPDNDSFTVEDATLWEQRLGLITNDAVSLANRKLAIIRKLNYPGTIIARQSGGFIESQLRLAGFDVYVHENPDLISIEELLNELNNVANLGLGNIGGFNLGSVFSVYPNLFTDSNIGGFNLGEVNLSQIDFKGKVVNDITDSLDLHFNIGNSRIKTFFIGGENIGDFANVPTARKDEFRQLILKLKPTETVAYLLINYT